MSDWTGALHRELEQWNFDGIAATLWWRDDDARAPSDALTRLLDLARRYRAPLTLAVIPSHLDVALAPSLAAAAEFAPGIASEVAPGVAPGVTPEATPTPAPDAAPDVTVMQHGYAHINHSPPGEKKSEFGGARSAAVVRRELADGRRILQDAFGARFVPALAPPWNRIAPKWIDYLAPAGIAGLSAFAPRAARCAAPGVGAVNTHVDIIDWKGGKRFIGAARASRALTAHLAGRRRGQFDPLEPTGLLTHHLAHDSACWDFLAQLLDALARHPAVKWLPAGRLFPGAGDIAEIAPPPPASRP
ncbi:MAG: polysaccharide deacetylase family protein [Gammaproteobacteria bacterium]